MNQGDKSIWRKAISPVLQELVPGSVAGVSILFTEDLPLEECGVFWTAVLSIARATEPEELSGYIEHVKKNVDTPLEFDVQVALLNGALSAKDFYRFPEGSLHRIIFRLKRNMADCPSDSPEEKAHESALNRIDGIIIYLAQKHPSAAQWIKEAKNKNAQRPMRQNYLRLV